MLGLVFVGSCGAFYSVPGLSTRAVLRARPALAQALSRLSGAAMLLIGLYLLAERLTSIAHA